MDKVKRAWDDAWDQIQCNSFHLDLGWDDCARKSCKYKFFLLASALFFCFFFINHELTRRSKPAQISQKRATTGAECKGRVRGLCPARSISASTFFFSVIYPKHLNQHNPTSDRNKRGSFPPFCPCCQRCSTFSEGSLTIPLWPQETNIAFTANCWCLLLVDTLLRYLSVFRSKWFASFLKKQRLTAHQTTAV